MTEDWYISCLGGQKWLENRASEAHILYTHLKVPPMGMQTKTDVKPVEKNLRK